MFCSINAPGEKTTLCWAQNKLTQPENHLDLILNLYNMKKKLFITTLTIGTLALSGFGIVNAASLNSTTTPQNRGAGRGPQSFMPPNTQALATLLKLNVSDLQTDLKNGQKLEDIATTQGVTKNQLDNFFKAQAAARLAEAKTKLAADVTNGKITQAQMDERLKEISEHKDGGMMHGGPRGGGPNDEKLAAFLGLSTSDLKTALQSGKKIEDVATTQGKTADQLKAFFTTQQEAHLAEMKTKLAADVASGKITQVQMDEMVTKMTDMKNNPGGPMGGHGRGSIMVTDSLATFLGMNKTDLETALKFGKKLEDIATTRGKTTDQVKAYLATEKAARLSELTTRLSEEVKNGKITQAQMDARLSNAKNHKFPEGKNGFGRPGMGQINSSGIQQ